MGVFYGEFRAAGRRERRNRPRITPRLRCAVHHGIVRMARGTVLFDKLAMYKDDLV